MNSTISRTLAAVNAACTQPPILVSNVCITVIPVISAIAITCSGPIEIVASLVPPTAIVCAAHGALDWSAGTSVARYFANASAAAAIGAENPAVSETQPLMNPTQG